MFNYSSLAAFEYIAQHWGIRSITEPKLMFATFLSILYGQVFSILFQSYLDTVDSKLLFLYKRINYDNDNQ